MRGTRGKADALRAAIASELSDFRAYDVPAECVRLGLREGEEQEAFGGKYRYVIARLRPLNMKQLLDVALNIVDDRDAPEL